MPDPLILPPGIRSRMIVGVNGLSMHILEAGHETPGRPLVLLLHGFPELAYSWRKVMVPLALAGFHVVAPDQRGYGRTTGWSAAYDQDLRPFSMLSLVDDVVALTAALGHSTAALLVGHDFGSPVAGWCAMTRPDLVRSVVMMSAPFAGAPAPTTTNASADTLDADLANLPRPRKHYHWYYATRAANGDMLGAPAGLHAFLRGYFHAKSADWPGNQPHPLHSWAANELAVMPTYYIMDRCDTMAATVAPHMPEASAIAANRWLTETELAIYAAEYASTSFQGGLNWYRCRFDAAVNADLARFADRTIDVPAMFISGSKDWGTYQAPGALERMQAKVCTDLRGTHLVDGAGHWVMQEQPERVVQLLTEFAVVDRA